MKTFIKSDKAQDAFEESLNFYSHLLGVIISPLFLTAMLTKANGFEEYFASILYGFALMLAFSTSSYYHFVKNESRKKILRIYDHSAIFILIAGTYTPLGLLVISEQGYTMLIIQWAIAIGGIILKVWFTGRFQFVSVFLYLLMGWLVAFEFPSISELLPSSAVDLILYGGLAYTIGVIFYSLKKVRFTHFIWHLFVLAGAIFHFLAVYLYVI
jgi:hemolysin III